MTVRSARPDDLPAIRALTMRAYGEYATIMAPSAWAGLEAALRAALDAGGPAQRIVAEREADGAIVGSVMLYPPESDAYGDGAGGAHAPELRLLAVSPDARGQGIGEALVRECIRRSRAMGATELGLHTSVSMRAAMRMYAKLGFVRAPEHDFQPEGAELVEGYRLVL